MHTWYNSLGCQTEICLHCMLWASAKQMKVFPIHVPCWKKKKCLCEHVRTAPSPASEKAFHDDFVASGMALSQLSQSPCFKAKCIGKYVLVSASVSEIRQKKKEEKKYLQT